MENQQDLKEFILRETQKLIERRDAGDNVQYVIDRFIHAVSNYERLDLLEDTIERAKRED